MREQVVTLEMFLGKASQYLAESDDFDTGADSVEEAEDELGDGADEGAHEEESVEGDEESNPDEIEPDADADDAEEDDELEDLGDEEDLDKSEEDITIKDVAIAIKNLTKNLGLTQKKIGGINFGGITFQRQGEVLDALKNVYSSARQFASEMEAFNQLDLK